MIITVYEKFKEVLPEWAGMACGIAFIMCLVFLAIAMLCDQTKHDTTVPMVISTVFLIVMFILLLVGAIFHEEVPDGEYCVVEVEGVDWEKHGLEFVTEEESGVKSIIIREPG